MAVPNPNTAPNLGTKRRRRRGKPTKTREGQMARIPGLKARAVGLRRQGRAPASDIRRRSARGLPVPPRPVGGTPRSTISPGERVASRVETPKPIETMRAAARARAGSSSPTPPTTSSKPPKPAVPAGQPPAFGARRKATLPPGLAKRTGLGTTPARPSGLPKPPKRPKRPKGY